MDTWNIDQSEAYSKGLRDGENGYTFNDMFTKHKSCYGFGYSIGIKMKRSKRRNRNKRYSFGYDE